MASSRFGDSLAVRSNDSRAVHKVTLYRDDCTSVRDRRNCVTCVFARVVGLNPIRIEDSTNSWIVLTKVPRGVVLEIGECAYFLIDTSIQTSLTCLRVTVVPESMAPVAEYQLHRFRAKFR